MARLLTVSVGLATVLASSVASADDAAADHLSAGLEHYGAGNYEAAIVEFEASYAINPDPQLLFAWAQAERLAGHCDVALPRYRRYLASGPSEDAVKLVNNGIELCEANDRSAQAEGAERAPAAQPLPWYKDPGAGAIGAGCIGVGVGVGFLLASSSNRDRSLTAATSAEFHDDLDRATTQRRIGFVAMALGGALIGGGIAYHFLAPRRVGGTAVVTTDGRSLFVAGAF